MKLIDGVLKVWKGLAEPWKEYLAAAGLVVRESQIVEDLSAKISIDFSLPGLQDLARETCRAIEPGDPARSLLYHVLASPNVSAAVATALQNPDSPKARPPDPKLARYPTLREIELIENYVFGVSPPALDDLRLRAGTNRLGIVVFALEYLPAYHTVHRRHADLCFSRTGFARVGTKRPAYEPVARGFMPNTDREGNISVVPCRFATFIAAQMAGNANTIGPSPFLPGDDKLLFWTPLQKLFPGTECVLGFDISVELKCKHVNEKLKRLMLALKTGNQEVSYTAKALEKKPFYVTEDLAQFSKDPDHGSWLLVPEPHSPMVAPAMKDGKYVTFHVPAGHAAYGPSMWFVADNEARHSPEFVHIRHTVKRVGDGEEVVPVGKSSIDPLEDLVRAGNYEAVLFSDYTADGWIKASIPELALEISDSIPAYSVLGQPDFFPLIPQQDLMSWWQYSAPQAVKFNIWPSGSVPDSLADSRLPANVALRDDNPTNGPMFDLLDTTVTAIVSMPRHGDVKATSLQRFTVRREQTLSTRATGVFAPGWDVSQDRTDNVLHLAAYGLGSPFPEDTMLCAALGSFWPAAVPDTARLFVPTVEVTVTPMLDSEVGWDGLGLPKQTARNTYTLLRLSGADYVERVWNRTGRRPLDFGKFLDLDLDEYIARTLVMARVYQVLGANTTLSRMRWVLLSLTKAEDNLPVGVALKGRHSYRLTMFLPVAKIDQTVRRAEVRYEKLEILYACPARVFQYLQDGRYRKFDF